MGAPQSLLPLKGKGREGKSKGGIGEETKPVCSEAVSLISGAGNVAEFMALLWDKFFFPCVFVFNVNTKTSFTTFIYYELHVVTSREKER